MAKRTTRTQDISRKQAAELINGLLLRLDQFTRTTDADRGQVLASLFDMVDYYGLQVPRPCSGEAHGNPFIDNCMVCMPHWGTILTPVKVK